MNERFTDEELAERWFESRRDFSPEQLLRAYTELVAQSKTPPRWTTLPRVARILHYKMANIAGEGEIP